MAFLLYSMLKMFLRMCVCVCVGECQGVCEYVCLSALKLENKVQGMKTFDYKQFITCVLFEYVLIAYSFSYLKLFKFII